jgi:DNA-3-methyladenine glycosylase
MKLERDFYARSTLVVARELVGMHVVRAMPDRTHRVARIVETEAYRGPKDRAAHSWRGLTPRTAIMYGPPGHAYVFQIYGMYFCLNAVTEPEGNPCAVLLRAVEPVTAMPALKTSGPGLLCRALEVDRVLNGVDLCGDVLWIERPRETRRVRMRRSPRIGVDYAGAWAQKPWRFYDGDSRHVSHRGAPSRAPSSPSKARR